jgi:hypothetical protein
MNKNNKDWTWECTREAFTDWVAEFGHNSGIKDNASWNGFSLWWLNRLIHKDNEVDFAWYQNLHSRLQGKEDNSVGNRKESWINKSPVLWLIFTLVKHIMIKFAVKKNPVKDNKIWFFSYQYNLINSETVYDRQYSTTPLQDVEFGKESAFLLLLNLSISDLLHPFQYFKKLRNQVHDLNRSVVILNSFLTIRDIFSIFFNVHLSLVALKKISKQDHFRKNFKISNIDCFDTLYSEMKKGFYGDIQTHLLTAAMFKNIYKITKKPLLVVTYGELLSANRPIYYFAKKYNKDNKFISIQHATVYKNKLGFYHRKIEFSGSNSSPMPDYYFVHGRQYEQILNKFYPEENIKIIGALKYDSLFSVKKNIDKIRSEIFKNFDLKGKHIILLAPSVNDIEDIMDFISSIKLPSNWNFVLSAHPASDRSKISSYMRKANMHKFIVISSGVSTQELLTISDIVVCGYSSVALEAAFFEIPSVRITPRGRPPLIDQENGVPIFENNNYFSQFMESFFNLENEGSNHIELKRTTSNFFYKIDGKTGDRFWKSINSL